MNRFGPIGDLTAQDADCLFRLADWIAMGA